MQFVIAVAAKIAVTKIVTENDDKVRGRSGVDGEGQTKKGEQGSHVDGRILPARMEI